MGNDKVNVQYRKVICCDRRKASSQCDSQHTVPMSDAVIIFLLFVFWVLVAAGFHLFMKRYFLASFLSACVMVTGMQVASYIELGHPDPFWLVSSVTGFFMASIVALIVGLPFRIMRSIGNEDSDHVD